MHELITFMLNFQEAALPPEIINVLQSIQSSACNFYTLSFAAVNTSHNVKTILVNNQYMKLSCDIIYVYKFFHEWMLWKSIATAIKS